MAGIAPGTPTEREPPPTRASLLMLLRRASPRDEAAWEEFVALYEPLVRRLARRSGLQGADADDLVQDAFRAVASAIAGYNPDPALGSFRGWLSKIARNLIVDAVVARRRKAANYGTGDTAMAEILDAQPGASPESSLYDVEYRRQVFARACERIKGDVHETTWQAFWRTGVEAEDVREVARSLNLTPGAVYVARSRVMARLRREVERQEPD